MSQSRLTATKSWILIYEIRQDGEKCVGALQDLLDLRSQHGPQEQVGSTLLGVVGYP